MAAFFDVIFRIPYKTFPMFDGGESSSAVLNVCISLPVKDAVPSKRFEALIDSGSSRCMFHSSIGRAIGLKIDNGLKEETLGVGGSSIGYIHLISLHAPGGQIRIKASFSDQLPIAGLLGMSGFFDHFRVTFDSRPRYCELERLFNA